MNWTCTVAIALAPAFLACSPGESHAAPPKTAAKLPPEPAKIPSSAEPATPPAPDANAATRKPVSSKPESEAPPPETPPSAASPGEPVSGARPPAPQPGAQPGSEPVEERLLSDEEAAIPTQEEADREAELAITDENADQEFDKLEKELTEGGGGG